jgi:hypothetical protein
MPKSIKVKSVRDLGIQFTDNPHKMIGQDGAFSIPINGETLWFFGDTLIGERVPGESLWYPGGEPVGTKDMSGKGSIEKMINNTGLLLKEASGRNGLNNFHYITNEEGKIKPLIERLPDEDPNLIRIWCLHGIYLNGKVYLYFLKIKMLDETVWPGTFEVLGAGLAVGDKSDWKFKRINYEGSDLLWKIDEPKFGSAVFEDKKNNWLYLYGVIPVNELQTCYLTRVRPSQIEEFEKHEYYSGGENWSNDIKKADPIFTNVPNEVSVSFNKYLGKYLAVHSYDLTGDIVSRMSQTPWGPWSEPVLLHKVKSKHEKELPYPILIYAGKEHPELSEKNGKVIYLTYIEFEEYYPHLIEVELD